MHELERRMRLTRPRSRSSVSGTPSMTESPRQMTPERSACRQLSAQLHAFVGDVAPYYFCSCCCWLRPLRAPSQSKMKHLTLLMRSSLSGSLARRAEDGAQEHQVFQPSDQRGEQEHACAFADVQHTHAAPSRGKPLSPGALAVLLWC